ncbi:Hypothetical_protein [Hexamita inflata]|uniref:Hypothetical_protein n=1 Tax=Hexamita inflata TaxID=28002 RepID=A0AA86NSZ1_9EUKA|nr:Hypothetical protein HINF_LOCUS11906 [Hexamita inflata]
MQKSSKNKPDIRFNKDGSLDLRSSMFKTGKAYLKKDGTIDGRCSTAKKVILPPTTPRKVPKKKNDTAKLSLSKVSTQKSKGKAKSINISQHNVQSALQIQANTTQFNNMSVPIHIANNFVLHYPNVDQLFINETQYVIQASTQINNFQNSEFDSAIITALNGQQCYMSPQTIQRLGQLGQQFQQIAIQYQHNPIIQSILSNLGNLYEFITK